MFFHHKFDHVYEGAPPPRVSFMVCAMPRSGSSLLCDVLAATELAGAPTEFFDPNQMHEFQRLWGATTFEQYVEALIAKKTSPNGVFGLKAHYHQFDNAFRDRDVDALLPNLRLVYIQRMDRVRQAVSFAIAMQTERWTSLHEPPPIPPVYDAAQIRELLEWIEREEVAWERYLARSRRPLLRLTYEGLVESVERTVMEVMRFLEIELPHGFELPAPTLGRQADAVNDEWAVRYRAEA
jgi:LPS sulfotransferase NodH